MKIIFHVDVNSAFLSWSALKKLREEPGSVDLRTIPSVVAGDAKSRHGIITAKSIPAKKYGIRTAETLASALAKCPQLVAVPADFQTYRNYSRAFTAILRTYSKAVEKVSIDEAYLDMSPGCALREGEPEACAALLKEEVKEKLGFTVNVGISVNRLLAKTASDFTKPDRIHTLWPEEVPEKLWPMRIGELHGCGRATAERLRSIGVETVGDAAHTDIAVLRTLLGDKAGRYIYESANGRGSDLVSGEPEEARGYSNETTLSADITAGSYEQDAPPVIRALARKVAGRLERDGVLCRTVGVSVKTDSFRRRSKQTTLPDATSDAGTIDRTAQMLARELLFGDPELFPSGAGIRLIGVSATKLDHGTYRQMSLFDFGGTKGWKTGAEGNEKNGAEGPAKTGPEGPNRP